MYDPAQVIMVPHMCTPESLYLDIFHCKFIIMMSAIYLNIFWFTVAVSNLTRQLISLPIKFMLLQLRNSLILLLLLDDITLYISARTFSL